MIYLIAGPPRCGKTTIAQLLAKKRQCSWISTDTLEGVAAAYTHESEIDERFPKRKMRIETERSNDLMYGKYSAKEITDVYILQARATHPAVKAVVAAEVQEKRDFVIEGHHLHPALIIDLLNEYGSDVIKPMIVIREDGEQLVSDCLKNEAVCDWFIDKTTNPTTYPKIADMILEYGVFFKKGASHLNLPVANMDADFFQQVNEIVTQLSNVN